MPEKNFGMEIDKVIQSFDPEYMRSDGLVDGLGAMQWDFVIDGVPQRVYWVTKG